LLFEYLLRVASAENVPQFKADVPTRCTASFVAASFLTLQDIFMKATLLALAVVASLAGCATPTGQTAETTTDGSIQRRTTVTSEKDKVALRNEMTRMRDQEIMRASAMRASNR
jgi:hypothetical protein